MPGVVENGSIAIISNGYFVATLDMSPSVFLLHTRTTNRLMIESDSAMVFASSPGHYEIESGHMPDYESSITGYRIGTAISTTVVYMTDPSVSPACPLAVRIPSPPTVDGFQVRNYANAVITRFDRAGRLVTGATTPPGLADLVDGELTFWVNASTGDLNLTSRVLGQLRTATVATSPA
jgi:hypothetical protein